MDVYQNKQARMDLMQWYQPSQGNLKGESVRGGHLAVTYIMYMEVSYCTYGYTRMILPSPLGFLFELRDMQKNNKTCCYFWLNFIQQGLKFQPNVYFNILVTRS